MAILPDIGRSRARKVDLLSRSLNHRRFSSPAMTRFTTDIQMRFRDIDGMGHVNNSVYLSYTELARTQFYMQFANRKTLDEIDFILAHVDIDFESQAVW